MHTHNHPTATSQDECCHADAVHKTKSTHEHAHDDHDHNHGGHGSLKTYLPAIISFTMLMAGLTLDFYLKPLFFSAWVRLGWYGVAYLPVGIPVIWTGLKLIVRGEIFTEFLLMGIATVGAFAIGEYPEGVAVMLFYSVGELFQHAAVDRAKRNIKALLDIRPDSATVSRDGLWHEVNPELVHVNEIIQVKPGEKIPLDGILISEQSSFNTAALTGESKPATYRKGETVLAGMVNIDKLIDITVSKKFSDSSLSKILYLVEHATGRKAQTELFIRKFAKVYTPIIVVLALLLTFAPYFIVHDYIFAQWLYRALIFLVISCPCALVISIPLGYFGGIGAASRNGILFKGSNYLDLMTKINTIVMDKTGTLTKGVFEVQRVTSLINEAELVRLTAALETKSTHPTASAIKNYADKKKVEYETMTITNVEEVAGHGLQGTVNGKKVLAGNVKLLKKYNILYDVVLDTSIETIIAVAIDGQYAGYFSIADELKNDAKVAIQQLHANGIREIVVLSGDKTSVTANVAQQLNVEKSYGDLLPEHKVEKVEALMKDKTKIIAFVGDGINDAPVLAMSNVGIAMGGLGSDVAIETADVIIQTDQPSKIATAIKIGQATKKIVWQNITLAFVVKALVLALGAGGLATMWEAVFADVGVAFLAILNSVRIQRMKF